jgi:peptide deformylase
MINQLVSNSNRSQRIYGRVLDWQTKWKLLVKQGGDFSCWDSHSPSKVQSESDEEKNEVNLLLLLMMMVLWGWIMSTITGCNASFVVQQSHNNLARRGRPSFAQKKQQDDSSASSLSHPLPDEQVVDDHQRRSLLVGCLLSVIHLPMPSSAATTTVDVDNEKGPSISGIHDPQLQNYYNPLLPNWRGTALPGPLSLADAYTRFSVQLQPLSSSTSSTTIFEMARWPDPILRRVASPIPNSIFTNQEQMQQLQFIARTLQNTARKEGAVGLAAQQCGIDASLIYIDGVGASSMSRRRQKREHSTGSSSGIFLVNPRIIHRSPEYEMLVWTEECLVLPPEFKATLLRDAEVTIEYETLLLTDAGNGGCGETKQITLSGELARCAQHEMDHDKGILIVDHVGVDELLSINGETLMANVEDADGLHRKRMQRAYVRDIYDSLLLPSTGTNVDLALLDRDGFYAKIENVESNESYSRQMKRRPWFVESACAAEDTSENNNNSIPSSTTSSSSPNHESDRSDTVPPCDQACLEERKRRIQERRAMMQQSRSSTNRGEVLELSRQRALLYGTRYEGLSPSVCSRPGFCP